jgi:glycosyltransferase involved in cell wall biosynthesis
MSAIPLKAAKKHGVPVRIGHAHNSSQPRDAKYLLKLFYKRLIAGQATQLFACSDEAGRWMFGNADFRVLNNAIDAGKYAFDAAIRSEVRHELGLPADALVVGHVGRFDPQKNHRFLVEIFEKMSKDARLLLVGDGVLRPDVEQQAEALGIRDRILFTGVRTDVDRLLQAMDVFLMPSLFEGLPVSIVEAQAAGLPCLISDKVPIECKKTELVTQLPLAASSAEWAGAVLSAAETSRRNTLEQIRGAGFDIRANAEWLQNYYLSFEV